MKIGTPEPVKANTTAAVTLREETIIPSNPEIRLKNILVPLDFSEVSIKSLRYAIAFARRFGAKITLLHMVSDPVQPADFSYNPPLMPERIAGLEEKLKDIRNRIIPAEIFVDIAIRESLVFDGIIEAIRELRADLVIATTHGRTGLKHLMMGSIAEDIVRRAPCPVLVVRLTEHDFV